MKKLKARNPKWNPLQCEKRTHQSKEEEKIRKRHRKYSVVSNQYTNINTKSKLKFAKLKIKQTYSYCLSTLCLFVCESVFCCCYNGIAIADNFANDIHLKSKFLISIVCEFNSRKWQRYGFKKGLRWFLISFCSVALLLKLNMHKHINIPND